MKNKLWQFINNDVVFWIFALFLAACSVFYIINKEDIKITVSFGQSYGYKSFSIGHN